MVTQPSKLKFSHNKPGKIFILIEGDEYVLKRSNREPGWPWIHLPATILYNVQENDPDLVVSSVNKVGAKIPPTVGDPVSG